MHPISLIFLGLCAFLLGFWLVRRLEKRKVNRTGSQSTMPPSVPGYPSPAPLTEVNRDLFPTPRPHPANTPRELPSIEPPQPADANPDLAAIASHDIRDLILANRQADAIKLLHEHRGWDLAHAKEYVAQQAQQQSPRDLDPEVIAAARKLLAENRKIVAIKLIYEHTGWSLKAAKDYVENSL